MTDAQSPLSLPEDRPLVTFALFAYNQERYIREAIEGAFAQTYSPLEIIISDDCSTDRTFSIIKEMTENYRGPHNVIARRNDRNLRPYMHVLAVAEAAHGELIVLAAGDDISNPNRAQRLTSFWKETGAWALHSRYEVIDEHGHPLNLATRTEEFFTGQNEFAKYFYEADGPVQVVHGGTSAYDIRLMRMAPKNDQGILSEDGVFSILLNLVGGTSAFVDESLILYRQHQGALSNFNKESADLSLKECLKIIRKDSDYSRNVAARCDLAIIMSSRLNPARRMNETAVLEDRDLHRARAAWSSLGFRDKVKAFRIATRRRRIGFLIPAIFGDILGAAYLSARNKMRRKK